MPSPTLVPYTSGALAIVAGRSTLSLVGSDGGVRATTSVAQPAFHPNAYVSWTSTSLKRLYYLNAGYQVRFLGADGSSGLATQIKVHQNEEAGFAVSPDEKRIAVSVLSYLLSSDNSQAPAYNGMRLYVEDLMGGTNHVDIFDSKTAAEFPIGWTGGNLVIAVSEPQCCLKQPFNPYGATEFHVANPDTGRRQATLCGDPHIPEGPIQPFGVMCTDMGATLWRWDGTELPVFYAMPYPSQHLNAASPDGGSYAIGRENGAISIVGKRSFPSIDATGYVLGWLDADHIVVRKLRSTSLSVYDLVSQRSVDLPGGSLYLGTFPTPIS